MRQISVYLVGFLRAFPSVLVAQQNGIAFLTLIPFVISSIALLQWDEASPAYFAVATPQSYALWPALGLFLLCLSTLIWSRNRLAIPAMLSALILVVIAVKAVPWPMAESDAPTPIQRLVDLLPDYTVLYGCYGASVVLTTASIVVRPTFSGWFFRLVTAALVADVVLFTFSAARTVLGSLFSAYYPSQVSVIMALLVIIFLRMVIKFAQENRATHAATQSIDPRRLRQMRRMSLRLWWPMFMIFAGFGLTYQWLDERFVKQPLIGTLNSYEFQNEVTVYEGGAPIERLNQPRTHRTVETAAKGALTHYIAAQNAAIKARITSEVTAIDNTTDRVMEDAESILPTRFPGTTTRRCGLLDFGCYIVNGVKSTINSGYLTARQTMLADLRKELDGIEQGADDFSTQAQAKIEAQLGTLNDLTRRRITETATGLRYFGWVMFIYSLVILAKSLMIVFARVFYSHVATTPAASGETSKSKIGKMTKKGSRVALRASDGHDQYYITFATCGNNVVDRRRIPQPARLFLRRLLSRNYTMCLVDYPADPSITSCDIIVDPPAEIVQWDLLESDEIFVDITTVIGFSRSCTFGRSISLSLGALIFGRAIYYSISGPGRVFLRTQSAPLAAADRGTTSVMQASSLIAWRRDTNFHVKSALTMSDTFFSGYSIKKADKRQHLVVYDTSQSRRVGTGGGILRMARAFLLPF